MPVIIHEGMKNDHVGKLVDTFLSMKSLIIQIAV